MRAISYKYMCEATARWSDALALPFRNVLRLLRLDGLRPAPAGARKHTKTYNNTQFHLVSNKHESTSVLLTAVPRHARQADIGADIGGAVQSG